MKGTINLSVMILLATILIFSPMAAFALDEGEATGSKMQNVSPEGSPGPSSEGAAGPSPKGSSEGDKLGAENPDPTSSPLAKEYKRRCSDHKPKH